MTSNTNEWRQIIETLRESYDFGDDPIAGLSNFLLRLQVLARYRISYVNPDDPTEVVIQQEDASYDDAFFNPKKVQLQAEELSGFAQRLVEALENLHSSRKDSESRGVREAIESELVVLRRIDEELQTYIKFECRVAKARHEQGHSEIWEGLMPFANRIDLLILNYGDDFQHGQKQLTVVLGLEPTAKIADPVSNIEAICIYRDIALVRDPHALDDDAIRARIYRARLRGNLISEGEGVDRVYSEKQIRQFADEQYEREFS